jgi:hypothetical protein
MGRRLLVAVAFALLVVPVCEAGDIHTSAQYVRNAIPAIEAYGAEHGGYEGMTLGKIRKWDKSLRNITIRKATKRTYCVQSTTRPFAHKAGPSADVVTGPCGTRGAPVPYKPPGPGKHPKPPHAKDPKPPHPGKPA